MPCEQGKDGKWYVRKKNGSLGTRGYSTKQKALNAQSRARALGKGMKPGSSAKKKSPKSSGKPSNPSGGAKTSKTAKIGLWFRKLRTLFNFGAPVVGVWHPHKRSTSTEVNLKRALHRTTGIYLGPSFTMWDAEYAMPTWQGWGVSAINDWWDRKTRTSYKISRGKFVHILKEAVPVLDAHFAASGTGSLYGWNFLRRYTKNTTGYDYYNHDWDGGRLTTYVTVKGLAWLYDTVVPQSIKSAANRIFPEGFNPF